MREAAIVAAASVPAVLAGYLVGWVRGVAAERRGAKDACAALLADERAARAKERARLEALAGWERERCAGRLLDKRIGPVAPEAALWWRN